MECRWDEHGGKQTRHGMVDGGDGMSGEIGGWLGGWTVAP